MIQRVRKIMGFSRLFAVHRGLWQQEIVAYFSSFKSGNGKIFRNLALRTSLQFTVYKVTAL